MVRVRSLVYLVDTSTARQSLVVRHHVQTHILKPNVFHMSGSMNAHAEVGS